MLSREAFGKGMMILCEIADRTPSEFLLEAYYTSVSDMEDQDFEKSIKNILRTWKYKSLPLPADIRSNAGESLEGRALKALELVRQGKWKTSGGLKSVCFEDPIIHMIISDWYEICQIPLENWHWFEKDFVKHYIQYAKEPTQNPPTRLMGKLEVENVALGFEPDDYTDSLKNALGYNTIVIGNAAKALEWVADVNNRTKEVKEIAE